VTASIQIVFIVKFSLKNILLGQLKNPMATGNFELSVPLTKVCVMRYLYIYRRYFNETCHKIFHCASAKNCKGIRDLGSRVNGIHLLHI